MQSNQFMKGLTAIVAVAMLTGCVEKTRITSGGVAMKGYVQNIEGIAVKNEEFRRVVYTARNCQLVVMALKPNVIGISALAVLTTIRSPAHFKNDLAKGWFNGG